jgi:gas vesicle protein
MPTHNREHDFEEFEHIRGAHTAGAGKHVFTGLLIGSVVGAVTMLLFAPRSGQETRAEIRDKAIELRDRTSETVKDTVSQAKSKAFELKENVWDRAAEIKQRGKQTAQEQLERAAQAIDNGKQKAQEY